MEVALLLFHLRMSSTGDQDRAEGVRRAGQVIVARNQLRRRGINSLIWESSQINEAVYYHDSILTLEGSEARIQLEGGTEIHVSENTLVIIEPPENRQNGEIRLKFVRGNLRARNPFNQTQVKMETVSVKIKPGSDVDLRQVNDGQFELRVQKGDAEVSDSGGAAITAGQGEILRMEKDNVRRLQVDKGLDWLNPPAARVYSHDRDVGVHLQWKGSAEGLLIQSLGMTERRLDVSGESGKELRLPLGQHRLTLRSGERSSLPTDMQILKAPLIHLLSPLPRDRAELDKRILFQWMQMPGVAGHEVRMTGQWTHMRERINATEHALSFDQEEDLEWSVHGLDEEGFAIPPLYTYPLYLRTNPLAAPKLKSPSLRRPAQENPRGAFWQRVQDFVFPRAVAEDGPVYEALFAWEVVQGADQYVVEISETSDFRNPLVTRTVRRNEFIWTGFALKPYYWRVAAGTRSGRMGVFSEPALVHLQESASGQRNIHGVTVRPVAATVPTPKTQDYTGTPSLNESPPHKIKPLFIADARRQTRAIFLQPGFRFLSLNGEDNVNARLQGFVPLAARAEWPLIQSDERSVRMDLDFQNYRFEPRPQDEYPFQSDIRWSKTSAGLLWFNSVRRWGYGLSAGQRVKIQRADYEAVEARTTWTLGPQFESSWVFGRFATVVRGRVHFSSGAVGGGAGAEVRYSVWTVITIGAGLEAEAYLGDGGLAAGAANLSLGFEF